MTHTDLSHNRQLIEQAKAQVAHQVSADIERFCQDNPGQIPVIVWDRSGARDGKLRYRIAKYIDMRP